MKILFIVFTGTGNTAKVTRALEEELIARGHETVFTLVRKDTPVPDPNGFDLVIAGYPVHAFNAPAPFLSCLKKLPEGKTPVYLVRTSGEPLKLNDTSGVLPRRILKRRGYRVLGEYGFVMPYNIIFRHSDEMAARMWRAAKENLPRIAEEIEEGKENGFKHGLFRRFVSFVLRIEHPAMPVVGLCFHANDRCVGCGKCAKVCPQSNISMKNGKPKFGGSCAGCMGCSFTCPVDAIRPSVLNGWRVNGAYTFDAPSCADEEVCDYCNRSYLNYFHRMEGK